MTETLNIAFLYKAASSIQQVENNNGTHTMLRSYYLMRCKDITKGHGLPEKHFASKIRCSKCCIEWNIEAQTKVKGVKLSKKQRQRIRSLRANKEQIKKEPELLNCKQIEQICTVCKQRTVILAPKPEKLKIGKKEIVEKDLVIDKKKKIKANLKKNELKQPIENKMITNKRKKEINVYSNSTEVFSLKNKNNTLASAQKEEIKVVKNNKKKKDKLAGLCQKAVLASAKLKEERQKQNKLNLFLKPST